MDEFKYDVGELIRCKYCRHNRNTEEPVDCDLKIASYSEDNYCSLAEAKNMAEYKFDVGDVVVCYYPHNKIYGKAYIVASRRHLNGFTRAYYELKDLHGLFAETCLEPVGQTLESNADLKTLFGGGKEHG